MSEDNRQGGKEMKRKSRHEEREQNNAWEMKGGGAVEREGEGEGE